MNQKEQEQNNTRQILPLFACPVYLAELGEPAQKTLDFCKNSEYERYDADNGWVSKSKYVLEAEPLSEARAVILRELNTFLYEILALEKDKTFYIANSWIQKISTGDWTHAHAHGNSIISGVYYTTVYEDSGDFYFEKSFDKWNLFPTFLTFQFASKNLLNCSNWGIRPKNGTLVLFPSHTSHYAEINKNKNDRYCIAFNTYVRGVFGDRGGVSDLVIR